MSIKNRGFGSMDKEKQRLIASKGGISAHQKGVAHKFTPATAKQAGRKGGASLKKKYGKAYFTKLGQKNIKPSAQ